MQGTTLYPLSSLGEKYSAIFDKETKKYAHREVLLEQKIPRLNCLWSDVVFMIPLDPSRIFRAMSKEGLLPDPTKLWYKIPIDDVKQHTMAWYSYPKHDKGDFYLQKNEVTLLNPEEYKELDDVPQEAKDYYKEVSQNGEQVFLFHLIPHIFIKGAIDVARAEIIHWA